METFAKNEMISSVKNRVFRYFGGTVNRMPLVKNARIRRLLRFLKWIRQLRKLRYVVVVGIAFYRRDPYAIAHILVSDKYLKKYCRQPTGPVFDTMAHPLMYIAYMFNPLSVAIFPMASPFAAFTGIIQWLLIAAAGDKGYRVDFVRPANLPYIF